MSAPCPLPRSNGNAKPPAAEDQPPAVEDQPPAVENLCKDALLDVSESDLPSGPGFISYSTFRNVLRKWRKVLVFRVVGQHAERTICAKLHKLRAEAQTEKERNEVKDSLESPSLEWGLDAVIERTPQSLMMSFLFTSHR